MRIGIISDIHTNTEGLRIALERMGQVDELLCAGDIVFQYRFGNEVIEMLRERGARSILGNHDLIMIGPHGVRARTAPHVRSENVAYLEAQPLQLDVEIGGKRLIMAHGSPVDSCNTYVYPGSPDIKKLSEIDADYIILGHTHYQMAERIGRALVINPGSAGQPRDYRNGHMLSYAILDVSSGEVTFDNYEVPIPAPQP